MTEPVNVLADAQFSFAKPIRPFDGFEKVYQGKNALVPIAFPGGLDPNAGLPGYAPNLIAGFPVPLGAKVLLWIPQCSYGVAPSPLVTEYVYQISWRIRNVADYRHGNPDGTRTPYHIQKQAAGAADTTAPVGQQARLIITAALETILFEQTQPAPSLIGSPATGDLIANGLALPADGVSRFLPLIPGGGFGAAEQGIADPAQVVEEPAPLFRPYFTIAKGDDMTIFAYRPPNASFATWDFANPLTDQAFSNTYGTNVAGPTHPPYPDLGIYVLVGSNPS